MHAPYSGKNKASQAFQENAFASFPEKWEKTLDCLDALGQGY
jgi:hypothetical protein